MTFDPFSEPDGATPITAEEREGLKQHAIATRHELNLAEQANILKSRRWAMSQHKKNLLTTRFTCQLHHRMFADVWNWAGSYRTTARNIGIEAYRIPIDLPQKLDDTQYQIQHQVYSNDEIAVRLHHQLVYVHPFPNGNGRHARFFADLIAIQLGNPPFSWGQETLTDTSQTRSQYIETLRCADQHDIQPLLTFARS